MRFSTLLGLTCFALCNAAASVEDSEAAKVAIASSHWQAILKDGQADIQRPVENDGKGSAEHAHDSVDTEQSPNRIPVAVPNPHQEGQDELNRMKTGLAGASMPRFRKGRPLATAQHHHNHKQESGNFFDWFGRHFDSAVHSFARWYMRWMKTPRGAAINEFCSTPFGAVVAVLVACCIAYVLGIVMMAIVCLPFVAIGETVDFLRRRFARATPEAEVGDEGEKDALLGKE